MSQKKRPNQKPAPTSPVTHGNVFAAFVREASSLGNEIEARRAFDNEVGAYLAEKQLTEDFESWRKARRAPPSAT